MEVGVEGALFSVPGDFNTTGTVTGHDDPVNGLKTGNLSFSIPGDDTPVSRR
jgi:hypothetical protein